MKDVNGSFLNEGESVEVIEDIIINGTLVIKTGRVLRNIYQWYGDNQCEAVLSKNGDECAIVIPTKFVKKV
jgi:uncharacterized Zn ribbon protein